MTHEEFIKSLEEKYPELYRGVYCEMSIGPGWYQLIDVLSDQLTSYVRFKNNHIKWMKENKPDKAKDMHELPYPIIQQVKEKFGTLRFYADHVTDHGDGAISMAEAMSGTICEDCGAPGIRRSGGWIRTLCDKHEEEYQERLKRNND